MANTEYVGQKPPLGVGNIISNALRLYFRNFIPFFVIALIPTLGYMGLFAGIGGRMNVVNGGSIEIAPRGFVVGVMLVTTILSVIVMNIVTGMITLAALDKWQGRPMTYARYFLMILQNILPLTVLTVVAALALMIGFLFFFIPGLYVSAMFFVLAPSVLVERAGFGGLSRSIDLTREYRWPIIGTMIVMFLVLIVISILFAFVAGFFERAMSSEVLFWSAKGAELFGNTIGYGIAAVFVAMVYARLREIKEGLGVEDLSKVFA